MTKANKNGKVSKANILALLGLAVFGVFSFLGLMFESEDGQLGYSIIQAIVIIGVLGFLLFIAIKAKQADSHFNRWKLVEIVAVSLYVVFALVFSNPFHKFFYVTSQKTFLQVEAVKEIAKIDSLYAGYNKMVKDATAKAVEQINNYIQSYSSSITIEKYIDLMHIDKRDINSWAVKVKEICVLEPDSGLREFKGQIDSWEYMEIAQIGKRLSEKGTEASNLINEKIRENVKKRRVIPVIIYNGFTYIHDGYVEKTFAAPTTGNFQKALNEAKGYTILGWGLFVLLHLIILLNYLVAERSGIVGPRKNSKTGGLDL